MIKKIYSIILGLVAISSFSLADKEIQIDLSDQIVYALEDGEVVYSGRISSGRKGRETPTGTFKITQKEKHHVSNLWPKPNGGAKMPYMMRLGSSAIALHLGHIPNYPASHGCIRLEPGLAQNVYRWAKVGTTVKVFGAADYSIEETFKRKRVAKKHKKYKKRKSLEDREDVITARFDAMGYYDGDIPETTHDNW